MDLKQLLSQTNVIGKDAENNVSTEIDNILTDGTTEELEVSSGEPLGASSNLEEEEKEREDKPGPRFILPWNKLEKGVKMNRLLIFIQTQKQDRDLTEQQAKELKNLLFKACETGLFNKISDVEYDESKAKIESIKNLDFNESSKKYKIKTGGTKNRSVSKSRSNIDRLTKKK